MAKLTSRDLNLSSTVREVLPLLLNSIASMYLFYMHFTKVPPLTFSFYSTGVSNIYMYCHSNYSFTETRVIRCTRLIIFGFYRQEHQANEADTGGYIIED